MQSSEDIKKKIKSLNATRQITSALSFVAAAKLQKAGAAALKATDYALQTKSILSSVALHSKDDMRPFFTTNGANRPLIIAIGTDRGLCGGYNADIWKKCAEVGEQPLFITVGDKIRNRLSKSGAEICSHFGGIAEKPSYAAAAEIGNDALGLFSDGDVSEIYIVYTSFKSTTRYSPHILKLLPIETEPIDASGHEPMACMLFEPSREEVLSAIVPKHISIQIYGALTEACAAQQAARMAAMGTATENADNIISDYSVLYNRARQAAITQEITEIVGAS